MSLATSSEKEAQSRRQTDSLAQGDSSKEESVPTGTPFQLCNPDGTPLQILESSEESDMAEKAAKPSLQLGTDDISVKNMESHFSEMSVLSLSEEESEELECPGVFERFMMLEKLLDEFPPVNDSTICDIIGEMLQNKERRKVQFNVVLRKKDGGASAAGDRLKALREKKDTALEKARSEFNRVTSDNVSEVIENLLALKVEKIDEMKEIAGFVFEKAISEPVYMRFYVIIIGQLKKTWKCVEEMKGDKLQTCFYGTFSKYLLSKLTAKHTWNNPIDINMMAEELVGDVNEKLDILEGERLFKKKQAIGAANLLVMLYTMNVTGPSLVMNALDLLMKEKTVSESIEMVCEIAKGLGNKFIANKREDVVERMINFLKLGEGKFGGRVDFLIETTINNISGEMVKGGSTMKTKNTFSSLFSESEEEKPAEKTEEEVISEYVLSILQVAREDPSEAADQIKVFLKTHSNSCFFTEFFIELISSKRSFTLLLDLFLNHLKELPEALPESLVALKGGLGMLSVDFPGALQKYSELICYLRGAGLIEHDVFNSLKTNEFSKKIETLYNSWKDEGDKRFAVVFP